MADKDRKRALFRAKLNEKQKKRIDSPLVRYNESDKPVCRVCDIVLKSDSDWIPHQASRKHQEAINNLKASASKKNVANNSKPEIITKTSKHQLDDTLKSSDARVRMSSDIQKATSSALPANFFDNKDTKRQKVAEVQVHASTTSASLKSTVVGDDKCQPSKIAKNVSADSANAQTKGALLPEGFFDNKEADLRACGIELIKPDVKLGSKHVCTGCNSRSKN